MPEGPEVHSAGITGLLLLNLDREGLSQGVEIVGADSMTTSITGERLDMQRLGYAWMTSVVLSWTLVPGGPDRKI